MGNLIKSLAIIQQNCINLLPSVQSNCNVLYSSDELSLTRSLLPEAMLVIFQNLIVLRKLHKMTMHYVFHDFAATRCQWNGPIVRSLALATLLKQRCHESSFPVIRNLALFVGSLIYECQGWCDWRGHLLQESWWDLVRTICFVRVFWPRSCFFTPFTWMLRGGAEFTVLFPIVGIEVQSSLVKALTNCSFKISTWSVDSE